MEEIKKILEEREKYLIQVKKEKIKALKTAPERQKLVTPLLESAAQYIKMGSCRISRKRIFGRYTRVLYR